MEIITVKDSSSIGWDLINDLSAIPDNEDIINEYLLNRLEQGLPYTWVGPILLSLNPMANISLDLNFISQYKDFLNASVASQTNLKPHIFAVVARSHYKLLQGLGRPFQVILISGDSGAGKTFNANQAINFLAEINESAPARGKRVEEYVRKIVSACPLITAFSTASTVRNARSSRHGQLIKFEYENGIISGASIQSFLLERSRVTRGSDNFAIFYQLIYGFPENVLKKLGLSKQVTYTLIGKNPYTQKNDLAQDFQETLNAMRSIGFSEEERNDILKVVALLIHLGNIHFNQASGDGCSVIDTESEESKRALENVCALTSLSQNDLNELFTTTLISTKSQWRRHSIYRRNLGSIEICQNRIFGIIRHLYDNLFQWLINRINQTLWNGREHHCWLGILDIFGFESFTVNGIEELSINYANERLQLYFMQEYLESGQRDLWEEGLSELSTPEIINIYKDRLNAIEINLFCTLNDASQSPIQCNLIQLKERFLTPTSCNFFKPSQKDETFIIKHYSHSVEYSLQDLLSKNSDKVPCELTSAFTKTSNALLQYLSSKAEDNVSFHENNIYTRKVTTLAKAKRSLDALLRELKKCDTHYVKCVRPRRIEGSWDKNELKKQLASTGIFDALPLARCKFPIRLNYEEFNIRYCRKPFEDIQNNHQRCKNILQEITNEKALSSSVHFGKRLIFFEESFFYKLENRRKENRNQCATKIQRFWKKYQLQKVSNVNSKTKCISISDLNIDESLSKDEKSQANLPDCEHEAFMSINNNDLSLRIKLHYSLLDQNKSNPNAPEINSKRNITLQTTTLLEDKCSGNFNLKFGSDLKTNFNSCSKVCPFKTFFLSPWVNHILATKGKEGRGIPATKEINERQRLHLIRINNNLHIKLNPNGDGYIVSFQHHTFFYKNRILSRQRLAEVPVRIHTRLTCLSNSHRLPRSELPRGLEDCL